MCLRNYQGWRLIHVLPSSEKCSDLGDGHDMHVYINADAAKKSKSKMNPMKSNRASNNRCKKHKNKKQSRLGLICVVDDYSSRCFCIRFKSVPFHTRTHLQANQSQQRLFCSFSLPWFVFCTGSHSSLVSDNFHVGRATECDSIPLCAWCCYVMTWRQLEAWQDGFPEEASYHALSWCWLVV